MLIEVAIGAVLWPRRSGIVGAVSAIASSCYQTEPGLLHPCIDAKSTFPKVTHATIKFPHKKLGSSLSLLASLSMITASTSALALLGSEIIVPRVHHCGASTKCLSPRCTAYLPQLTNHTHTWCSQPHTVAFQINERVTSDSAKWPAEAVQQLHPRQTDRVRAAIQHYEARKAEWWDLLARAGDAARELVRSSWMS